MKSIIVVAGLFVSMGLIACAGSGNDGATPGGEQDIVSPPAATCAPITTLECQSGFESTEVGCMQSHVAGAAPLGKCVSVDVKKLVGNWSNDVHDPDSLSFFDITFDASGSYKATGGCRPNPSGPSCFAISIQQGDWTVQKSGPQLGAPGGATEIVLDDHLNPKTSLFYTLADDTLSFSKALVGDRSVFKRDIPTCSGSALGSTHLQANKAGGPDARSAVSCDAGFALCRIDPNGSDNDVCSDPTDCFACSK